MGNDRVASYVAHILHFSLINHVLPLSEDSHIVPSPATLEMDSPEREKTR